MNEAILKTLCEDDKEEKKFEQIANVIDHFEKDPGNLIQILHLSQEIYGYLPLKVQKFISHTMDIPLSDVSGVVSFYSFSPPNPAAST
jgi:NADH:ubiquinone oxidoreductase subunit E